MFEPAAPPRETLLPPAPSPARGRALERSVQGPAAVDESELQAHLRRMRELRPGLHVHADAAHDAGDMVAQGEMTAGLRIVVVLEGSVDVSYGERRVRLAAHAPQAGALLVSVAEPDLFMRRSRRGGYARRVSVGVEQQWLEQTGGAPASGALGMFMRQHLSLQQWQASQRATALAEQIVQPPDFEPMLQNLYLESRVLELVAEALASVQGAAPAPPADGAAGLRPHEHKRLRELRDYLAHSGDDELNLDAIARRACINPNTLQKQFRALYGTTVFEFVRESRLQRARQALERDGVTVGRAAELAGYTSAANFATAYKRRFGLAPKLARGRV